EKGSGHGEGATAWTTVMTKVTEGMTTTSGAVTNPSWQTALTSAKTAFDAAKTRIDDLTTQYGNAVVRLNITYDALPPLMPVVPSRENALTALKAEYDQAAQEAIDTLSTG